MNVVDLVKKINDLEYLTKKQYSWLATNDSNFDSLDFSYIGDYSKQGDYLNLQVYTEYLHHEYIRRMECGI
tara:strand:- start:171 stop:383 length:213 start_codon:yes stop_codon:yes gene_type:complete